MSGTIRITKCSQWASDLQNVWSLLCICLSLAHQQAWCSVFSWCSWVVAHCAGRCRCLELSGSTQLAFFMFQRIRTLDSYQTPDLNNCFYTIQVVQPFQQRCHFLPGFSSKSKKHFSTRILDWEVVTRTSVHQYNSTTVWNNEQRPNLLLNSIQRNSQTTEATDYGLRLIRK